MTKRLFHCLLFTDLKVREEAQQFSGCFLFSFCSPLPVFSSFSGVTSSKTGFPRVGYIWSANLNTSKLFKHFWICYVGTQKQPDKLPDHSNCLQLHFKDAVMIFRSQKCSWGSHIGCLLWNLVLLTNQIYSSPSQSNFLRIPLKVVFEIKQSKCISVMCLSRRITWERQLFLQAHCLGMHLLLVWFSCGFFCLFLLVLFVCFQLFLRRKPYLLTSSEQIVRNKSLVWHTAIPRHLIYVGLILEFESNHIHISGWLSFFCFFPSYSSRRLFISVST